MSKYGTSNYQLAKYLDRQEIEHALNGKIRSSLTKDGDFAYEKADKVACDKVILENFDATVFEALEAFRDGKAIEKTLKKNEGFTQDELLEYMKIKSKILDWDEQDIYYTEVFNKRKVE